VFEGYLTSCHTFGTEMNDMKRRVEQIQNSKYLFGFTHINISESAGTANNEEVYDQWVGNNLEGGVLGLIYMLNNHIFSRLSRFCLRNSRASNII